LTEIVGSDRALVLLENERQRALLDAEMKFQISVANANATYASSGPVTGANSVAYAQAISDAHSVKSAAAAAVIASIAKAKQTLHR
jgi:HPt (histidine-containing phosphotransfer) domain-containing protein